MKKIFLLCMLLVTGFVTYACESSEKSNKGVKDEVIVKSKVKTTNYETDAEQAIKKVVMTQLDASAKRDVAGMKSVLHNDFRIVVNQAERLTILDLKTMLSFYEQGKFGGEEKEISIKSIDVQGNLTAMVKVIEKGKKAIFNIYFSLINIKGEWKIIQEVAYLDYLKK